MSRLINEIINVHIKKNSCVGAFIWRRRLYRVEGVLSGWCEPSRWWHGEPEKHYLRVTARNGTTGVYELCRFGERWFLHRVID